uniref:Uncharacterized protein n=1 Tax=Romanomermis culicivorax TaxID=13658 RepID=A0A915HX63_ROMCU
MMDEPTTSQQAEVASNQQKPQRIVREYKIPYRRFGRQGLEEFIIINDDDNGVGMYVSYGDIFDMKFGD